MNKEGKPTSINNNQEEGGEKIKDLENSPGESMSPEQLEEKNLDNLYKGLDKEENKLQKLEKEKEVIEKLRKQMGATSPSPEDSKAVPDVEGMKDKVLEAEKKFLNSPENKNEGEQESIEDFLDSDTFKELQKEMDEKAEEAEAEHIKKSADKMMDKYREKFSKAENGEKAEALFRKKYERYSKQAIEMLKRDKDIDRVTTHITFNFLVLKDADGEEVLYVENIDMENKQDSSSKPMGIEEKDKGQNEGEKPEVDENASPELMGEQEKEDLKKLEGEGYTQ